MLSYTYTVGKCFKSNVNMFRVSLCVCVFCLFKFKFQSLKISQPCFSLSTLDFLPPELPALHGAPHTRHDGMPARALPVRPLAASSPRRERIPSSGSRPSNWLAPQRSPIARQG